MVSSDQKRAGSHLAIGGIVRLLCEVRLVVVGLAMVFAVLDGEFALGIWIALIASPFSFVPALNWGSRGDVYARSAILLAADLVVAVLVMVFLSGSQLMAVYAAATVALWSLLVGPRLALVMVAPICLLLFGWLDPHGAWGWVLGLVAAAGAVFLAWGGHALGQSLRRHEELADELSESKALRARTAERVRLARDLHDTVAGDLAGLTLSVAALRRRIESEAMDEETVRFARTIEAAVCTTHQDMRRALGELRDAAEPTQDALRAIVDRWEQRTGHAVELEIDLDDDDGRSAHLRAVLQELLENVRKHADARRVAISVKSGAAGEVVLRVEDDGRGFDASRITGRGRFGLQGIRERVAACGGSVRWEQRSGGGTVARARFDVEPRADLVEA
ncbi:sensor histidine kinase [Isoptericola jiangsuensis]|uniref:sensor histidine kinase n=1 Tax=Isoptericola jiangsuensis TaxID=548579 RepID=UPI003AAC3163